MSLKKWSWALGLALAVATTTHAQEATPAQPPATPTPSTPTTATPTAPTDAAPLQATSPAPAQGGTLTGAVIAGTPGKPGGIPLPGVTVTATNSLTGKKYATTTDIDGAYAMAIPRNGRYVVRAELSAFAAQTAEVLINAASENGGKPAQTADFGMTLASRAAAAESQQTASTLTRGLQSLNLNGGASDVTDASANPGSANNGTTLPSLSGLGDNAGASTDSVAVSGQVGQTNGLANFSEDEIRSRIEDAVAQGRASGQIPQGADVSGAIVTMIGGMMGGGGGGIMMGGGGGGGGARGGRGGGGGGGMSFRNFNPAQPHGSFFYTGDFSALDSAPWSTTLTPTAKPTYTKNSFGASLLGSPYIPGLTKPNTKNFAFINFAGSRNTNPEVLNGTVPTDLERMGDFSKSFQFTNSGTPTPVSLYDPKTGTPIAGNVLLPCPPGATPAQIAALPNSCITPQAQLILNNYYYYPRANVTAVGTSTYNYQTITTAGSNSANLNARLTHNFGQQVPGAFGGFSRAGGGARGTRTAPGTKPTLHQNMNLSFNYSHSASDLRNIFLPLGGTTTSEGYGFNAGYTIGYGRLSNSASVNWNRSHSGTRNYFTGTANNPAANVGINEPAQLAINGLRPNFYNGLPNLNFTNFQSLSNTAAQDAVNQTISFSDFVSYRHKKHNYRTGFDLRRVHQDSLGGSNPLGSLTFSGFNTESPSDQAGTNPQVTTGSGFADFLIGLPQQSRIQAGLNKIYLREFVFDAYAQDDFRLRSNLTLNFGLRWEYFGPFSEKNGRLSNLTGVSTGTTNVGCVTPFGATVRGITCAAASTSSLLHSDDVMYSPRVGIAWHPTHLKDTVIRAGYGTNFNTTQFAAFAKNLSYQQPFALTENNALGIVNPGTGCSTPGSTTPTLASAFGCAPQPIQNTFAVNPNYRLGFVQVYNLDIQRTLPLGIVLNLGYNGSKGANLDLIRAPNHTLLPTGKFIVTTPQAVAFTYEDSVGQSHFNALTVSARKRLQKGVSLGGVYQYAHSIDNVCNIGSSSTVSCLQNDARLDLEEANSAFDVRHRLTGDWTIELPFGPNRPYLNKGGKLAAALDGFLVSGSFTLASGSYFTPQYQNSANSIAGGGTFTLRPDRVFAQPIAGDGKLRAFFNKAAFVAPGLGQYGSASRNSIEGPGQVQVNASLSRSFKLGDTRNFEGRVTAANVFNTVQYSGINTTLNSATFGQVTGAAAMRRLNFTARYRF